LGTLILVSSRAPVQSTLNLVPVSTGVQLDLITTKKSPFPTGGFTSTQTSLNTGSELWVRVFVISAEPGSKPVASSSLFLFVHIIYVSPCKVVRVNARFM